MSNPLSIQSAVVAVTEQVSCDLSGETAVLSLKNNTYYGLNPVASRVWNLIQEPKSLQEVRDFILTVYKVDAERCESDLLKLIGELASLGLVKVRS